MGRAARVPSAPGATPRHGCAPHPKQHDVSHSAHAVLTPASHVEQPAEQPLWQVLQLAEQPASQLEHAASTALPQP